MKTAIRVLIGLKVVVALVIILFLLLAQGMFKEIIQNAYNDGEFIVNGAKATEEDLDLALKVIPIVCGIGAFIALVCIVLLIIDFFVVSKAKSVATLVFGVLLLATGSLIIGILQILHYVLGEQDEYKKIEFEQ